MFITSLSAALWLTTNNQVKVSNIKIIVLFASILRGGTYSSWLIPTFCFILLLWNPLKLFQLPVCITHITVKWVEACSGWVLINSPGTRDMFEAADRTVCEATVDNFKVPLSTKTLNTTHTYCARGFGHCVHNNKRQSLKSFDVCYLVFICK